MPSPELDTLLNQIPELRVETVEPEEQEHFLKGYSWSALVYNVFYYFAMKDWVFFGISILCSIVIFALPVLLILPFVARRRAWQMRTWDDFSHFQDTQKKWDRTSIYGLILAVMLIVGIYYGLSHLLGVSTLSDYQDILNQYQSMQN